MGRPGVAMLRADPHPGDGAGVDDHVVDDDEPGPWLGVLVLAPREREGRVRGQLTGVPVDLRLAVLVGRDDELVVHVCLLPRPPGRYSDLAMSSSATHRPTLAG